MAKTFPFSLASLVTWALALLTLSGCASPASPLLEATEDTPVQSVQPALPPNIADPNNLVCDISSLLPDGELSQISFQVDSVEAVNVAEFDDEVESGPAELYFNVIVSEQSGNTWKSLLAGASRTFTLRAGEQRQALSLALQPFETSFAATKEPMARFVLEPLEDDELVTASQAEKVEALISELQGTSKLDIPVAAFKDAVTAGYWNYLSVAKAVLWDLPVLAAKIGSPDRVEQPLVIDLTRASCYGPVGNGNLSDVKRFLHYTNRTANNGWVEVTDGTCPSLQNVDRVKHTYTLSNRLLKLTISSWVAVVPRQAPRAPTQLTAAAASSTQINLSWTDNSSNESEFVVERAAGGTTTFALAAQLGPNVNHYSDDSVQANTSYVYRVVASNAFGTSSPSNSVAVQTPAQ